MRGSRNQVATRDLAGGAPTIDESWTGGGVLEGQGRVIGLIQRERL